jgi:opacity protein-like surface antigen
MTPKKIRMKRLGIGCLFFLSVLLPAVPAPAADWYVRGQVGYEASLPADFTDTDCSSSRPPALFGCAAGCDGQPIGAYGDFGRFPLAEGAFGRQILPWLRADLSLAYRFRMDYKGNANFLSVGSFQPVSARADSLCGMVNVFIDISGFLAERKLWRFQPYVGGGLGLSHNRIEPVTFLFPQNPGRHKLSVTPSGEQTNLAFMLAFGTGVILTERLRLDVSYRYFDLGRVETAPGQMIMDIVPAGIAVNSIETRLKTHGLAVGLRWHF